MDTLENVQTAEEGGSQIINNEEERIARNQMELLETKLLATRLVRLENRVKKLEDALAEDKGTLAFLLKHSAIDKTRIEDAHEKIRELELQLKVQQIESQFQANKTRRIEEENEVQSTSQSVSSSRRKKRGRIPGGKGRRNRRKKNYELLAAQEKNRPCITVPPEPKPKPVKLSDIQHVPGAPAIPSSSSRAHQGSAPSMSSQIPAGRKNFGNLEDFKKRHPGMFRNDVRVNLQRLEILSTPVSIAALETENGSHSQQEAGNKSRIVDGEELEKRSQSRPAVSNDSSRPYRHHTTAGENSFESHDTQNSNSAYLADEESSSADEQECSKSKDYKNTGQRSSKSFVTGERSTYFAKKEASSATSVPHKKFHFSRSLSNYAGAQKSDNLKSARISNNAAKKPATTETDGLSEFERQFNEASDINELYSESDYLRHRNSKFGDKKAVDAAATTSYVVVNSDESSDSDILGIAKRAKRRIESESSNEEGCEVDEVDNFLFMATSSSEGSNKENSINSEVIKKESTARTGFAQENLSFDGGRNSSSFEDARNLNSAGNASSASFGAVRHSRTQKRAKLEMSYSCEFCPKKYMQACNLKRHVHKHHKKELNFGGDDNNNNRIQNHQRKSHSHRRPFKCPKCSKSVDNQDDLISHMETHEGSHYNCHLCPLFFFDNLELKMHVCSHNKTAKGYECTDCESICPTKKTLEHHLRTHEGTAYRSRSGISGTAGIAIIGTSGIDGDVMHYCNYCEAKFPQWKLLEEHVGIVHRTNNNSKKQAPVVAPPSPPAPTSDSEVSPSKHYTKNTTDHEPPSKDVMEIDDED